MTRVENTGQSRTGTTAPPRRTILVSDRWTFLPGDVVVPTPAGSLAGGLGAVVTRIAATLPDGGVLLLDARAAAALGLPAAPADVDQLGEELQEHPAVADLGRAGWSVARLGPWITVWGQDRPRLHLGILPLINPADSPVICSWPHDTLAALELWHRLIGAPYYGTPGWAGTEALRQLADAGRGKRPTFKPAADLVGPADAYELPFLADHFKGPLPRGMRHAGAFDMRMAYLSSALVVRLAVWSLKPTGKVDAYDPDRAGWWLVRLSPWQDKRIPDPAGYGDGDTRWVTGPTLSLIDPLVAEGIHGGYEILDSWTAPIIQASNGRPLKAWAERIRDGLYADLPGPAGAAVKVALKQSYSKTVGSLNNLSAPIYRPDWHFAVIAQSRANLWRRMWGIGRNLDRWPLWIETDNVWYPLAGPDAHAECPTYTGANGRPAGMVEGNRLGNCQIKAVRELRPAKAAKGAGK